MKASARRVPFQEAYVPRVNFARHFYLGVIDCSALKDELDFNVPAWDTLPKSGKSQNGSFANSNQHLRTDNTQNEWIAAQEYNTAHGRSKEE